MYQLVFLLIFSGFAIVTASNIKLDISFKTDEATKDTKIQCDVTPPGPQRVVEGHNIQFFITTRSRLKDFWCLNAKGHSIFSPSIVNIKNEDGVQVWKTVTTFSEYSMSDMNGAWACSFNILKPHDMNVKAPVQDGYVQSTCHLEFQITVPSISLDFSQLSQWEWTNEKQQKKLYNYKFTEGMTTFDCVLRNPTEHEETYTLAFHLDSHQMHREPHAIIKAQSDHTLTWSFNLTKSNKEILCSAIHVNGPEEAPSPQSYIKLLYVPPSPVFMHTVGPPGLGMGEFFQNNYTQIYHYNFTGGGEITIKCILSLSDGYENNYGLTLSKDKTFVKRNEGNDAFVSHDFTLEEKDSIIVCTAKKENRIGTADLPDYLHNEVRLHYSPPPELLPPPVNSSDRSRGGRGLWEGKPPILRITATTGPGNLYAINDTLYNYNYTKEGYVNLCCRNVGSKNTRVAFYAYSESSHENEIITTAKDLKATASTWYNVNLAKENKVSYVGCAAYSYSYPKFQLVYNVEICLHYKPPPDLFMLESTKLQKGGFDYSSWTQAYLYNFSDGEEMTLKTTLNYTGTTRNTHYILTYQVDEEIEITEDKDFTYYNNFVTAKFKLKKNNKVITLSVKNESQKPLITYKVLLHNVEDPVSGLNLEIRGVDSCTSLDPFNLKQACNYTYNETLAEKSTISLSCVLCGKIDNKIIYRITCDGNPKEFTLDSTICKTVLYELPLKKENYNVTCKAAKANGEGNDFTAEINFHFIPPPPTTTTEATEATTTVTTVSTLQDTPSTGAARQSTEPSVSLSSKDSPSDWWLKWALLGGALLVALCAVACFIMMYRQKKQQPPDSTYANLAKDQSNYQTMPIPAPRSSQMPNTKPKVTVENNYSEPKDSQDMSDALYADPKRFNGESDTYAEPYVKSKPKSDYAELYAKCTPKSGTYVEPYAKSGPKSDTYAVPYKSDYAEPYAASSEGNYAELSIPGSSRELYAKPIPKAQRKPKEKDDSNYSNVFGDDYANTKK